MPNLIDLKTTTNFQNKVYEALLEIPIGKITTYKLLGAYIGCKSSQAIGQALKRNPFAPDVPCHRVIKSDLRLSIDKLFRENNIQIPFPQRDVHLIQK